MKTGMTIFTSVMENSTYLPDLIKIYMKNHLSLVKEVKLWRLLNNSLSFSFWELLENFFYLKNAYFASHANWAP